MKPVELLRALGRPAILGLLMVVVLSASRLLLVAVFWERVSATDGLGFIVLQGLRFDLILLGLLLGPLLLFKPFFHTSTTLAKVGSWIWPLYLGLAVALAFQVEASTLSFIREYDSRPNFIYVEYLSYPREVLGTLLGAHLLELIGVSSLVLLLFHFTARWFRKDPANGHRLSWKTCLLSFPLMALAVIMAVRSTLDHRPVNPSIAAFSTDSMVNQLALNSPYSLLYALYEHHRDSKEQDLNYGEMDDARAVSLVLADAGIPATSLIKRSEPTLHHHQATFTTGKPHNLVIILEESFGAEFVRRLGGKDLAPRLEQMAGQGIWFEQLYATGTRSVRGIEAVVTGFTPSPRNSVVKLMDTQNHFFTLGSVLEQQGYRTSFIYGGEAHFDNMRGFFLNNGFQTVIDEKDYTDPQYRGTWGVSDEDLFKKADEMFSYPESQPFFSLVFTSSNHEPFDIPDGRVVPEAGEEGARETAVKYADYALGEFLQKARRSAYWDDTVFLIIADHNSRVYGEQLIPIERFHIPGLIVGGPIAARVVPGISSQIDMLPTVLSLIGASANIPALGHDLTRPEYYQGAGRAMMQFNRVEALLVPGKVVVLQPELPPAFFLYEAGGPLLPDPAPNRGMGQTALAYFAIGPAMIRNHWYTDSAIAAAGAH
jgi:phosphoglycerol transferase MdoB-like AlkP superfamily enzyme